ncbi:MAG: HlyD family secretion protein, partial [Cyanobacteria bacterium J06643_5]
VTNIGLKIGKQQIFSTDPIADIDRRVVEVKIRLDKEDSQKVKSFTNLQVEVLINI